MQKAKIEKTKLSKIFDMVIISDEVGIKKPDPQIFYLALQRLNVNPDESLYVGDNLKNDVGGCQSIGMKGVWFNPRKNKNDTSIVPFMEICNFAEILPLIEMNSGE
jgi:putative hydrolase of the HAD superfamily